MTATALYLRDVETDKRGVITLDADQVNPEWKIGDIVRIDIDDPEAIPDSVHGTFEIIDAVNMDIVNLDK